MLRVCSPGDYLPFALQDKESGEWTGIDVEMMDDLADSLSAKTEYITSPWSTIAEDTQKKCDIGVGGVTITANRAKHSYYSIPTVPNDGKTPIVRCGTESGYDTVQKINQSNVRVITPIGGTNEAFVRSKLENTQVILHRDNTTIFQEILEGAADVMITDVSEVKWASKKYPGLCSASPDQPFTFTQKGYLLPLGDNSFKQYVDVWLNIALNDGTYNSVAARWE
ncbi:transporter substrate-binding domain-containing protein [Lysinibacter sp. HNR]|uniref:transporter substrate-binding domain-containing protein n=1 Tax=Lysinibacter sp. HNR TaxID=3031408 RepID=UPI0024360EBC|nr:transporter substrate-binding domain-containing protein [Lysinibacter sp. HNR]WGD37119.1 transporter substrate-binding domain-containing protein [Lysinibacter sp. HNR]